MLKLCILSSSLARQPLYDVLYYLEKYIFRIFWNHEVKKILFVHHCMRGPTWYELYSKRDERWRDYKEVIDTAFRRSLTTRYDTRVIKIAKAPAENPTEFLIQNLRGRRRVTADRFSRWKRVWNKNRSSAGNLYSLP